MRLSIFCKSTNTGSVRLGLVDSQTPSSNTATEDYPFSDCFNQNENLGRNRIFLELSAEKNILVQTFIGAEILTFRISLKLSQVPGQLSVAAVELPYNPHSELRFNKNLSSVLKDIPFPFSQIYFDS